MASVNVFRVCAQLVVLPVLARLLSPADYGLVGIAMPFIMCATMLADAGVGMSLVRTPASERVEWCTCFWISAACGLGLGIAVAGLGPVVAWAFGEPKLSAIVSGLGPIVTAQGLFLVPRAALQQECRFRTIAVTEIIAIGGGLLTAVWLAYSGAGVWALVWQQIAFHFVRLVGTWTSSSFRPEFLFDLHRARDHLRFGRDMLGISVLRNLSRSWDGVVIGHVLGAASVGMYSMAMQLASLPVRIVSGPLQYVLYAHLAELKEDANMLEETVPQVMGIVALLVLPAIAIAAVAHGPVFAVLLSEKWSKAGEVFALVVPGAALQAVTSLAGSARLVKGRTDLIRRSTAEFGVIWLCLLVVAAHYGLVWTGICYSCAVIAYTPRFMSLCASAPACSVMDYMKALAVPVVVAIGTAALYVGSVEASALNDVNKLFAGSCIGLMGVGFGAMCQSRMMRRKAERVGMGTQVGVGVC
jgi:PST family polysaccharide transporter